MATDVGITNEPNDVAAAVDGETDGDDDDVVLLLLFADEWFMLWYKLFIGDDDVDDNALALNAEYDEDDEDVEGVVLFDVINWVLSSPLPLYVNCNEFGDTDVGRFNAVAFETNVEFKCFVGGGETDDARKRSFLSIVFDESLRFIKSIVGDDDESVDVSTGDNIRCCVCINVDICGDWGDDDDDDDVVHTDASSCILPF